MTEFKGTLFSALTARIFIQTQGFQRRERLSKALILCTFIPAIFFYDFSAEISRRTFTTGRTVTTFWFATDKHIFLRLAAASCRGKAFFESTGATDKIDALTIIACSALLMQMHCVIELTSWDSFRVYVSTVYLKGYDTVLATALETLASAVIVLTCPGHLLSIVGAGGKLLVGGGRLL